MKTRRIFLSAILFPTICYTAWQYLEGTFDPRTAGQRELVSWLTSHAADSCEPALQDSLYERCSYEWQSLCKSDQWEQLSTAIGDLSAFRQQQWNTNLIWLCGERFKREAVSYQQIDTNRQAEYLADWCRKFFHSEWPAIKKTIANKDKNTDWAAVQSQIESWINKAGPRQHLLRSFWADLQMAMLRNPDLWKHLNG